MKAEAKPRRTCVSLVMELKNRNASRGVMYYISINFKSRYLLYILIIYTNVDFNSTLFAQRIANDLILLKKNKNQRGTVLIQFWQKIKSKCKVGDTMGVGRRPSGVGRCSLKVL